MNVVYISCICIHLYTTLLYVALNGLVEDYASICYMNRLTKDVSNSLILKRATHDDYRIYSWVIWIITGLIKFTRIIRRLLFGHQYMYAWIENNCICELSIFLGTSLHSWGWAYFWLLCNSMIEWRRVRAIW